MFRHTAMVLCGAIGLLLTAIWAHEWWVVGVQRDPVVIRDYPFAAENVVGDGGWNYANPELYAWSAFGSAVVALVCTALLVAALSRRSRKLFGVLVVVVLADVGASAVLSKVDWERRDHLTASE